MKNYYSTLQHPNAILKCMTSFFLIIFFMLLMLKANAQSEYVAGGASNIKVSIDSNKNILSDPGSVSAQGSFIVIDGQLDNINSLNLSMAINNSALDTEANENISFNLTHVLVLPVLKKIQAIGILTVAGISTRTNIEFDFVVNSDKSITLNGAKRIKLSDYRNDSAVDLVSFLPSNDELKLSISLNFKSEQVKTGFIAKSEQVGVLILKNNQLGVSASK